MLTDPAAGFIAQSFAILFFSVAVGCGVIAVSVLFSHFRGGRDGME